MSWGVALRNAVGLGLGGIPSVLNAPPYASLKLNFTEVNALDPRITFTRASSATYFNSAGVLSTAANDVARFDYDPVTLAARGLLIEEQRTNLVFPSEDFAYPWSIYNATRVANAGTAPNGTLTADRIESSGAGIFRASVGVVNATAYTYSVFLKHVSGTGIVSNIGFESFGAVPLAGTSLFNLLTGTVISNGAQVTASSITAFGNGWYRVSVTATSTDVTTTLINYAPAGDQFLMWGAQLEQGAFSTSYIPTTTAAATRASDVASMTGANFSDWYNQVEGTLVAEFGPYGNGGPSKNFGVVDINNGTSANIIRLFAGSTVSPVFAVTVGTVTQAYISSGTITPTDISKIAASYKADDFARSVNGAVAATDSSGTVPAVNRMLIGAGQIGVGELNGHLRSFAYYPKRLSNTALPALTRLPLWTPSQISTALWLDAADASTIVLNGANVNQWRDKSGNSRHFVQGTSSLQPAYSTTGWGTQPAIVFDGVDDELPAVSNWTGTGWSWYVVGQRTSTASSQTLIGAVSGTDYFPIANNVIVNTNLFRNNTINDPAALSAYLNGAMIKDKNALPTMDRGVLWTNIGNKSIMGMCGVAAFGSAPRLAKSISAYVFGGLMVEVVATPNDSTTAERQTIEGYLAWKWGLVNSLPAGHPYKNSPPTI